MGNEYVLNPGNISVWGNTKHQPTEDISLSLALWHHRARSSLSTQKSLKDKKSSTSSDPYSFKRSAILCALPAEIQKWSGGSRNPLVVPAEEVELCHRAGLVGLQVLQVEAPHEEILAPDVLRDKIHLHPQEGRNRDQQLGCKSCLQDCRCKISGMKELHENFIFISELASMGGK